MSVFPEESGELVLTEEEEEASERSWELSCWSPPPDHKQTQEMQHDINILFVFHSRKHRNTKPTVEISKQW